MTKTDQNSGSNLDISSKFPIEPGTIRIVNDYIYDAFRATYTRRFRRTSVSLGVAALAFLIGLGVAALGGFATLYLATPAVYLLSALLSFAMGRIRWLSLESVRQLNYIREAFLVSDEIYVGKVLQLSKIVYSVRVPIFLAALYCLIGWTVIGAAFLTPTNTFGSTILHLFPPTFPSAWFDGTNAGLKMIIVDSFVLYSSISVVQLAYGGIAAVSVLPHATDGWDVVPIPSYLVARSRSLADYFLTGTICPAIGVLGVVLLYGGRADPVLLVAVGVFVLFGIFIVLVPIYAIRRVVSRARDQIAKAVSGEYRRELHPLASQADTFGPDRLFEDRVSSYNGLLKLQELMNSVNDSNTSVYRLDLLLTALVSQSVPFLGFLIPFLGHLR